MTNLPAKPVMNANPMMDPGSFEHMQRVGKMLAMSPLFPEHLRKPNMDTAIANGTLVVNMAIRLNEDPLTVAQNIYFVNGKPGWSSSYMIGKANQHGVFKDPISWEISGEGDSLSVTAFANLAATGKRVSATCGMEMAKAENWTKNAKYKSMPEQMLRYRSATFLIRLYCPEVMIGVPAQVEIELGMKDITPNDAAMGAVVREEPQETVQDAVVVEDEPEPEKVKEKPVEEAKSADGESDKSAQGKIEEETTPKPKAENAPDVSQFVSLSNMIKRDLTGEYPVDEVLALFNDQVTQMEQHAPDVYADLQEHIEAVRADQK